MKYTFGIYFNGFSVTNAGNITQEILTLVVILGATLKMCVLFSRLFTWCLLSRCKRNIVAYGFYRR
ncbi:hypothetical protein [Shewanella sp. 10N.286.54.B9]|uniref:hypothetical protein n=1 Tax=Shewanella sp. 10N.286.54.B9 TaxID=3229719 RepID=UPI00354CDEB5